jgi:hypothetical protein
MFLEGGRRDIRDRRFRVEIDPVDGPPTVTLFETDLRCCMDAFDSEARIGQLKRQRHREAPGMSSAKQFLRVRALAFTHARTEVVWTVKRAAPKPHVAGAMSQISMPFCVSRSDCHHALQPIQLDTVKACTDIQLNANVRRRQPQQLLFLPDRGYLTCTNGISIAQPASGSETTELAESDGDVHPHLRQREPLRAIIGRLPQFSDGQLAARRHNDLFRYAATSAVSDLHIYIGFQPRFQQLSSRVTSGDRRPSDCFERKNQPSFVPLHRRSMSRREKPIFRESCAIRKI